MKTATAAFLFLLLAYASLGHAALGGLPQPFDAASTVVEAKRSAAGSAYLVRATTLDTGTLVREYLADSGLVFALSWEGPILPDLQALLGKYFDLMLAESARMPRAGRSHLGVNVPEVVIHSGGHMRAFEGRAWIPAQLPPGFGEAELR